MKNGRLLALLASVALVAGCSSSRLTADTGAYIPPGGSVVLSASGGAAKIRVSRTEGLADDEGAGIRMYSQPAHAENAELAPPAHTAGQLPIGAFIAMKQVPPGHSIVIVNDGSATTRGRSMSKGQTASAWFNSPHAQSASPPRATLISAVRRRAKQPLSTDRPASP